MEITYLGHSSFKIRGKTVTIITDPFDPETVGLKYPKVEADIITVSHHHKDHNYIINFPDAIIIDGPGEYKIKDVDILGLKTFHDETQGSERGKNTIYEIRMEGLSLVHVGDLGHVLSDQLKELLGNVDILFVPVGGKYTLDAHKATEVISQLEPKIVIPMHYLASGISDNLKDLLPVENFIKEMGKTESSPQDKLLVTRDKLPEEMQVIVLK